MEIETLKKQIKTGNLKSIYFFFGEEQYLLNSAVEAIRKKLIAPGTEDFNLFIFSGRNVSVAEIIETAEQFPQMSEKKLILVKNSGIFNQPSGTEFKLLKERLNDLPEYSCIIFIEDNFDKKKEKNIAFIEEYGGVVRFDRMPVNRLEIWLSDQFKKQEKYISEKDVAYMISLCGQSLETLTNEASKLLSYTLKRERIVREDIDAVVCATAEYRVYDMLDSIMSGRRSKAYEQLKYLKDAKEQPNVILSQMLGKLSEILMCKQLREAGLQANDMVDYFDFKRPVFAVKKTIEEGRRYTEKYLTATLKRGLSYDLKIKSGNLDGWTAVEMFLSELLCKSKGL